MPGKPIRTLTRLRHALGRHVTIEPKTPPGTFRRFSEKYHTTTEQLADLARQARPRLLVLYHYNSLSSDELQADMMSRYAGHFVIGRDLDVY